jgi:hypothetical protein
MLPDWDIWYPNCEPIGHHLRTAFRDRWVRFHSLPESKRYPESPAEYEEVLARHRAILGDLAADNKEVVLLTTGYSETPEPVRTYPQLAELDPAAVPWRTIDMHVVEQYDSPNYWHIFASKREWRTGELDQLVRLVADDIVSNVLIVAPDCRWVLHPYDGGMDVIAESTTMRGRLRSAHREWLSKRADGL